LRPATPADYDFIYQVKKVALGAYTAVTWGWDEAFLSAHFAEGFDPAEHQVIVADLQDIGELAIENGESDINLAGIYILPQFQRRGFGSAVTKDLISEGKLSGRPVRLQVLKVNPAKLLFEFLGFNLIEEKQNHFVLGVGPKLTRSVSGVRAPSTNASSNN